MRPQRGMSVKQKIVHGEPGRSHGGFHMPVLYRLGWRRALAASLFLVSGALVVPPLVAHAVKAPVTPPIVFSGDGSGRTPVGGALLAAVSDAVNKHRTLLIPKGEYLITGRVPLPVGSQIQLAPGATLRGSLPGTSLLQLARGSSLAGGTVRNDSPSDAFDVDLANGATSVTISGVRFAGAHTNSVYINSPGVRALTVDGCTFVGVTYGVLLNPGAIDAVGLHITNNTFTGTTADAIEINAATGGSPKRVHDVTVSGNVVSRGAGGGSTGGFGVGLAGVAHFTVSGNRLTDVRNEAVHIEDHSSQGAVLQNQITGGGVGYRPAIAVYRTTDHVLIEHNRIERFAGDGIAVLWDKFGSSTNIQVVANAIDAVKGSGITVSGDQGTGPFEVEQNLVDDVGGSPIAVLGSHHFSSVTSNTVIAAGGGDPIYTKYQGQGRRVYTSNTSQRSLSTTFDRSAARLNAGLAGR